MKIGICLKQVPASDTRIQISSPDEGVALSSDIKWEINPYDEFALEEGLRLKDAGKASEVIVFTLGDSSSDQRIRDALARGADRAVRLDDPALVGSDSLGVARALAAALKAEEVSIVLAGKQAADGDNAQVPGMIAELLDCGLVAVIDQLEVEGEQIKAWRRASGGVREVVETKVPVVLTADKGLNEPRYSNLKGIMMAKKKKIDVRDVAALGLDPSTVGTAGSTVAYGNWGLPPARPSGRIIEGDNATAAKELVRLLREEAKVI